MTQLCHHLHVVFHSFFNTLSFNTITQFVKKINLLYQVVLNTTYGPFGLVFRCYKKVGRINFIFVETSQSMISKTVNFFDTINFVIPPSDTQHIVTIGHSHIHGIALYTKISTLRVDIVSHIERIYQFSKKLISIYLLTFRQRNNTTFHSSGATHTINTRHRRYHHHVFTAREQSRDGAKTQFINFFIDG